MEGGTIYGKASSLPAGTDASLANSAQNYASLEVYNATAKWGTGGTYTKGGVPQTGGGGIVHSDPNDGGGTDDTLIAALTSGPPKTIKITGYNSQDITVSDIEIFLESRGAGVWPPVAGAFVNIDGQTITVTPVNYWNTPNPGEPWTGTGKFFIVIECRPPHDPSKDGANYVYSADGINATPVDIKDEVTTLEWSKFIWLRDYTAG
jgi:hypothetical protein